MPNSIKSFTERRLNQAFLDELFAKELASAEYGHMIYSPSSSSTKIILKVGRVGLAIGRRGKTIKTLSEKIKKITGEKNISPTTKLIERRHEKSLTLTGTYFSNGCTKSRMR